MLFVSLEVPNKLHVALHIMAKVIIGVVVMYIMDNGCYANVDESGYVTQGNTLCTNCYPIAMYEQQ